MPREQWRDLVIFGGVLIVGMGVAGLAVFIG